MEQVLADVPVTERCRCRDERLESETRKQAEATTVRLK
jgi:hypothetical protein